MEVRKKLNLETLDPDTWEEICMITDHSIHASCSVIQGCSRTMSLVVVGEITLWLRISSLTDKEKVDLLDAPVKPKELFGSTVDAMRQKCDVQKRSSWQPVGSCVSPQPPHNRLMPQPQQGSAPLSYSKRGKKGRPT